MENWTSVILLSIYILSINQGVASTCALISKCGDCIQDSGCVWCSDTVDGMSHCRNSSDKEFICNNQLIDVSTKDPVTNKCPCEFSPEENSIKCDNNGVFQCGVCYCNPGYSGRTCQCMTPTDHSVIEEKEGGDSCKSSNASEMCSGHGACVCGRCECNYYDNLRNKFYGPFCECNDYSCDSNSEGVLCGNNKECICGKCLSKSTRSGFHASVFRSMKKNNG